MEYFLFGAASLGFGLTCLWHAKPSVGGWWGHPKQHPHELPTLGAPQRHHSTTGPSRQGVIVRRCIALLLFFVMAVVATRLIVSLTVRKLQTGSMTLHEYEWYGMEATGQRMFPGLEPRNMSAECLDPRNVAPPPHIPELRRAIDPSLLPSEPRHLRVHVVDLEHDLFSFLWDSVLVVGGEADDVEVDGLRMPRRYFPEPGIEFVLVQPPERLLELPPESVRNVLVIGSRFERLFVSRLPRGWAVGMVLLGGESCRSGPPPDDVAAPLKFAFLTYGDCTLVDNRRFFVWPLGPSAFHGFPPRIEESALTPADQRPVVLNLMATFSTRKPTRMQALMAAEDVCEGLGHHRCHLAQTNAMFKFMEWFETELGSSSTNFRSYFASDTYPKQLAKSKLTLCPSGNTPEQYRIWEAIIAGSIPVVEDPPFTQGLSLHPAFGNSFGCLPEDIHRLLKETNAPVFFVRDWRVDLPAVVREAEDTGALLKRQNDMITWFQNFRTHMRVTLLEAILVNMK